MALDRSNKVVSYRLLSRPYEDVWTWLTGWGMVDAVACCEQISVAIFGANKSSNVKLYGSYQACLMALTASRVPFTQVKPTAWQTHHGIRKNKGEPQPKWKSRLVRFANSKFPREGLDGATADAALIALYLKETYEG